MTISSALERLDHWIQAHLGCFLSLGNAAPGTEERQFYYKSLSELCMFAVIRMVDLSNDFHMKLRSHLIEFPFVGELEQCLLEPSAILRVCYLMAYMKQAREPRLSSTVEAELDKYINSEVFFRPERLPHRQLDLLYFYKSIGRESPLRLENDRLVCGLLRPPCPVFSSIADAYALTHAALYRADFGKTALSLDEKSLRELRTSIAGAVARYMVDEDNDITAELLFSMSAVFRDKSDLIQAGTKWLISQIRPDGAVPSPPGGSMPKSLTENDEMNQWATHYHTTLVSSLYLAHFRNLYGNELDSTAVSIEEIESALIVAGYAVRAIRAKQTEIAIKLIGEIDHVPLFALQAYMRQAAQFRN